MAALVQALLLLAAPPACAVPDDPAPRSAPWNEVARFSESLPDSVRVYSVADEASKLRAWYARIRLSDPSVSARIVPAAEAAGLETVSAMAARTGACVVVNGGYFVVEGGRGHPRDALLLDGELRHGQRAGTPLDREGPGLGLHDSGRAEIRWCRAGADGLLTLPRPGRQSHLCSLPSSRRALGAAWPVRSALQAGPFLLSDGMALNPWEPRPPRQPRTAAGITADGDLILLVVDGRQSRSRGASFGELTQMLTELGCRDALSLDGGGSSTFTVLGETLNRPEGGRGERAVANGLAILWDRGESGGKGSQ